MNQTFHFIAIGGAVMHQMAIYLHQQGNTVSGSDDVIFDPAHTNLEKNGLLPSSFGWDENRIHDGLDAVILGMHAKSDNPELKKAQSLGLTIYSFPEFIFQHSKNKKRIVVAGSHGKTTITSMIMHILNMCKIEFDYLVGSRIKGFNTMVQISNAPIIIIEGDEYLSSPIDLRSKFLHYRPDVAIISGIAWDHINVFPSFQSYLDTFEAFIRTIDSSGSLIYYEPDIHLQQLIVNAKCQLQAYSALPAQSNHEFTAATFDGENFELQVFGQHNMENIMAAVLACKQLDIPISKSLRLLNSFEGAAKRLEILHTDESNQLYIYRDFAHAPSKLNASLRALEEKYKTQQIVALFELHTFSSLQDDFLPQYKNSLQCGNQKVLFLDKDSLKIKNRPDIEDARLIEAFNDDSIQILRTKEALFNYLKNCATTNVVFAFMSSGNFGGFNISDWIQTNFVKK